jgi:hypothetical protein
MVTSFAGAGPPVGVFAPRCGIREDDGQDIGRGVVGNCGAESPSVCFLITGKLPECCFVADQFAPESADLEGAGGGFDADTPGPAAPALPRCCLVIDPLPDCWPGANVCPCARPPLWVRSADEVDDTAGLAARTLKPQFEQEPLLASHSLPQRGHNMVYLSLCSGADAGSTINHTANAPVQNKNTSRFIFKMSIRDK